MTVRRVSRILEGKLDAANTPSSPYKAKIPAIMPEPSAPRGMAGDLSVDLSAAAKLRSRKGTHRSMQDINESSLPDILKKLLVTQRESKQNIIRKISELKKVKDNLQLPLDLRKQRTLMIQTEIMALETSYVEALNRLDTLMTQMGVSNEQADTVALLLMS